ncbi:MAG: thermonuclease family protein [Myxococcales bacterium]|nr:thermonuclease family protein [Myxococcales bacterium]
MRLVSIALALGAACGLGACSESYVVSDEGAPDAPTTDERLHADPLPEGIDAPVLDVIDGDTIRVEVDGVRERVRYIGVDTPELGRRGEPSQPFGEAARDRNRALVDGQRVRLAFDVGQRDHYGRLLAYVYAEDGSFVNARLVAEGYARVMTVSPNVQHARLFLELERDARAQSLGLWGR